MDNTVDGIPCDAFDNAPEANIVEVSQSMHSFPIELGMEFESDEHALFYYNKYAISVGFLTRKEYLNKNKSGCVTSRKITCSKEGHKDRRDAFVKNPRKARRTGCLAHIIVSRDQSNGKYRVTSFEAEHNHPLAYRGIEHMFPLERGINDALSHAADLAKVCPKSSHEIIAQQISEHAHLGVTDNDQRKERQRDMKLGEAGSLLHYFEKRRLEDPSLFFAIHLDAADLITNIFWADAKMIVDYKLFGDVVSFDTTYITKRNHRPFALFVGMNHYRRMVIFGAALMYDATIESFKWLFETFLKVMSGKKPKTILTHQDAIISNTISLVMPEVYHRLCVWHIERSAPKHLNHVFRCSDSFGKDFYKCINDFEEEEEFLNAWEVMLDKYDLRDNDWLKTIFSLREKWAPVYGRHIFSAGMRSTQLNESFNNTLRDCLKCDADLVQFFEHLERAVEDKRCKELKTSYDVTQGIPQLKVDLPLLIHARDMYTPVMFEMVQDEWVKSLLVVVNSCIEDGPCHIFKVSTISNTKQHTVIAKPSDVIVSCSCKKFENLGILCSHALKVLDMMNVKMMIPSHYILPRWTKDARIGSIEVVNGGDTEEDPVIKVTNRYRIICPTFVQIAARASESKAGYELVAKYANELATRLEAIFEAESSNEASTAPSTALEGFYML